MSAMPNPRAAYGQHADLLMAIINDNGGTMEAAEWQEAAGLDKLPFEKCIQRLKAKCARAGQRVHIIDWTKEPDCNGERRYWRPVFKVGHGKHKPRPPRDDQQSKREWWAKQRDRLRAANPFEPYVSNLMRKDRRPCHTPTNP